MARFPITSYGRRSAQRSASAIQTVAVTAAHVSGENVADRSASLRVSENVELEHKQATSLGIRERKGRSGGWSVVVHQVRVQYSIHAFCDLGGRVQLTYLARSSLDSYYCAYARIATIKAAPSRECCMALFQPAKQPGSGIVLRRTECG